MVLILTLGMQTWPIASQRRFWMMRFLLVGKTFSISGSSVAQVTRGRV